MSSFDVQHESQVQLVGREGDVRLVAAMVEGLATEGAALLLSGEPGVGKTALLDVAAELAARLDIRVLRAAGVQFEAEISFSGLNQALRPLLGELEQVDFPRRDALLVALGLADGPVPDRLVVCNAALALLRRASEGRPVVLMLDDLPWLDRASAGVFGFVARRLAGSRVGFLAASRSEDAGYFERAGLPQHELQPLEERAATELVRERFPTLAPSVRRRLLLEGQGNPLALLELPRALSGRQRAALETLPAVLPLGHRLQTLFASRVLALPAPTRRLLLLAVLDGTGELSVLQAAAGGGLADLQPAELARLVYVDERTHRLAFRHPLIRSAIVELSTSEERRAIHRELSQLLDDQSEHRTWHLAEATVEPDENVADQLVAIAHRILERGDAVGAVAALIRAADLTPRGADRSRRLAEAAYIGADVTGELRSVSQLLADARRADPELGGSLQAAVAAAYLILNGDGNVDTAHRLLVQAIETADGRDEAELGTLMEALHTLMLVCFFGGRSELWAPFESAIGRLEPHVPLVLNLCSKTFSDPVRSGPAALEDLDRVIAQLGAETDPSRIVRTGIAAFYVDRLAGCRDALWRVVSDGRDGGAIASAIDALMLLSFDDLHTGQWDEAQHLAEEGVELCEAHGYRLLSWPGRLAQALLAATRGDYETSQRLSDEMTGWAVPRGVAAVQHYSSHARTLAALGRGDFEEAYQQASSISSAGILASHTAHATWVMMDLVEAAVRTGRRSEAAAHVAAIQQADVAALSPRMALIACGSAAMAAAEHDASSLFDQALATPGVERWPFELARVQLNYGEALRRAQLSTQSRQHLAAAVEIFERLRARPWAKRAGNELRATGQHKSRGEDLGIASLTPQEREIAMLAAAGLSNKQIGERLFLSHRTVGAHLYRVFPKLGVPSRAALRDALTETPPES